MGMTTKLPFAGDCVFTIKVDKEGKAGIISSHGLRGDKEDFIWNFGADVLESFVLALACASYDLDERLEGVIDTVIDAMSSSVEDYRKPLRSMSRRHQRRTKALLEALAQASALSESCDKDA
jgi:hypothetical protein